MSETISILFITCLLLGVYFLLRIVQEFQWKKEWTGSVRKTAEVVSIQYDFFWENEEIICDSKSVTRVLVHFEHHGKVYMLPLQYENILSAPSNIGQQIRVLFQPDQTRLIPWEKRPRWMLLLAAIVILFFAVLFLLIQRQTIFEELKNYRVDSPNLTGTLLLVLIGLVCVGLALLTGYGLLKNIFQPAVEIFQYFCAYHNGKLKQIEGTCIGYTAERIDNEISAYYPMISVSGNYWHPEHPRPLKNYRAGTDITLYQDSWSGRYYLPICTRDIANLPGAIIVGIFVLCIFLAFLGSGLFLLLFALKIV